VIDSAFYLAFEEKYRGARDTVKSRLKVYLPFIQPLSKLNSSFHGLDLGCGRGEWLELMRDNKVDFRGVDLDLSMLDSAKQQGLNVSHRDVLEELQSLDDESLSAVSGFHIAEHLPFELLKCLISESFRVLVPGGLLILETPNPENITVGTSGFYLDPSHTQPIPYELMSFVSENVGFERVKILKLNEPTGLKDSSSTILLSVLNGVSPDYSVVAQKAGSPEASTALVDAFEREYGITLETLANKYDVEIKTAIQQASAKAELGIVNATSASKNGFEVKLELTEVRAELDELKATLAFIESELVRQKLSYKVDVLLRRLLITFGFKPSVAKYKLNLIFVSVRKFLNIRARVNFFIGKVFSPIIKARRRKAAKQSSVQASSELPSRARVIYSDLKAAIKNIDNKTE
jgi:SAM-dependent methyltransferase